MQKYWMKHIRKTLSDKPAMVVELKYDHSAEGAIARIKEKHYTDSLKEYCGNLLLVGINYDKKKETFVRDRENEKIRVKYGNNLLWYAAPLEGAAFEFGR